MSTATNFSPRAEHRCSLRSRASHSGSEYPLVHHLSPTSRNTHYEAAVRHSRQRGNTCSHRPGRPLLARPTRFTTTTSPHSVIHVTARCQGILTSGPSPSTTQWIHIRRRRHPERPVKPQRRPTIVEDFSPSNDDSRRNSASSVTTSHQMLRRSPKPTRTPLLDPEK